jgi:glycosyltransferase involved in cell wall biosynthesis
MKIIYVENVRIPSERAHSYQIVQTCAWFARAGHEVVLVNPDRAGGKDAFNAYGVEPNLFQHVKLRVTDPLSWKWFMWKKMAYVWQRLSFAKTLRRWAKNQTADVWYTRDPAMIDILRDKARHFVLELHDRPDSQPIRWKRIRPFVKKFIVISNGLKQMLQGLSVDSSDIQIAPDGYDPKDFAAPADRADERKKLGLSENAFVAIYAGGFYHWKGVDLVIRAWSGTDEGAQLVLIGGPQADRRRLESLITPEIKDRVRILPYVDHAQVIKAYSAADVGLLTSSPEHEIGRIYTSPLKQFEYLAAGLPILASDVPSSHEILNESVAVFYQPTETGFLDALERVHANPAWRAKAKAESHSLVAPYTWEARAKTIFKEKVVDYQNAKQIN